jgi:aryl-alcohol dehydrogenase-like predicted oxidoreductase
MKHRALGKLGWNVSEIGFGSWAPGSNWGPQNDADSVKAIYQALDLGCNFIDTARAYGDGRSERIIAKALKRPSKRFRLRRNEGASGAAGGLAAEPL